MIIKAIKQARKEGLLYQSGFGFRERGRGGYVRSYHRLCKATVALLGDTVRPSLCLGFCKLALFNPGFLESIYCGRNRRRGLCTGKCYHAWKEPIRTSGQKRRGASYSSIAAARLACLVLSALDVFELYGSKARSPDEGGCRVGSVSVAVKRPAQSLYG